MTHWTVLTILKACARERKYIKRVLGLARPVFVKVDRAHLKCGHMRHRHNTNLPRSKSDDGLYKSRSDSPEILSRETRQAGRVENVNESSRFDSNRLESGFL